MPRRPSSLALCLCVPLALAGCRGGGGGGGEQVTTPAEQTPPRNTDVTTLEREAERLAEGAATPVEAASNSPLAGAWQIVLVPEAQAAGLEPPTMPARFEINGDGLAGSVGATRINDGTVAGNAISFQTSGLSYTGVSGDRVALNDAIAWQAVLYDGDRLVGTAVSNGVESAWEAVRP